MGEVLRIRVRLIYLLISRTNFNLFHFNWPWQTADYVLVPPFLAPLLIATSQSDLVNHNSCFESWLWLLSSHRRSLFTITEEFSWQKDNRSSKVFEVTEGKWPTWNSVNEWMNLFTAKFKSALKGSFRKRVNGEEHPDMVIFRSGLLFDEVIFFISIFHLVTRIWTSTSFFAERTSSQSNRLLMKVVPVF